MLSISVVIPVFNRPQELQRAVLSVLKQSMAVDEIIIVDDGSTDSTKKVIGALKHNNPCIKSITQSNQGVSAARNQGIKLASSDWIAFLDSDDEWLAHKVDVFLSHIHQHPECLLFHSDEIWIRNGVRVNAMKKHKKRGGMIFKHCLPLCVISPSASILHKSLFTKIGLFDESLPACEDYDFWLRICHDTPVCFCKDSLIKKYGGHKDQLSAKYWGMDRFRIKALHQLLQNTALNEQDHQDTVNVLCKKTIILIKGAKKHDNESIIQEFTPILEHYDCT